MLIIVDKSKLPYEDEDMFIYDYYHNSLAMDKYLGAVLRHISLDSFCEPHVGDKIIINRQQYKVVSRILDYSSSIFVVMVK